METKKVMEEGEERIYSPLDNLLVEINVKEVKYAYDPAKVLAEFKGELMEVLGWVKFEKTSDAPQQNAK